MKNILNIKLQISLFLAIIHDWFCEKKRLIYQALFPEKISDKMATGGGSQFIDRCRKEKIDNLRVVATFYLKHKKQGRVIVVKGFYEDIIRQYGEDYEFQEPMIKDVGDEWDQKGNLLTLYRG